ncbi:MAG: YhdH/YhfP family quinone oxidoreductase [Pirellulales bacterium]
MSKLPDEFTALVVSQTPGNQTPEKTTASTIQHVLPSDLPAGDVTIRVAYSSLNYKDALAIGGHPGVVRRFPHVPGIDAAGTVVASDSPSYTAGQKVLVTGFDLGAGSWGGYSEYIRVPANWVVPLPAGLTAREAMIFGTAGFTAAQSLSAIEAHGVGPEDGELLVTGATGGVGSLAVAMAARAGYQVVAATGKSDAHAWLEQLGAARIVDRHECTDESGRPLLGAKWAGAIDTVGGAMLTTALRSTALHGCVTCCGMVAGDEINVSIFPFILRGVALVGIDSAWFASARRGALWQRMAGPWRPADLEALVCSTASLEGLDDYVHQIRAGKIRGRVVVEIAGE